MGRSIRWRSWLGASAAAVVVWASPAAAQDKLPEASGDISVEQVITQAEMFAKKRDWSKAESAFQEAVGRDPKSKAAWEGLVRALQKQQRWKDAVAALEKGRAALGAGWSEGTYQLAYTHRKAGNTAQAITLYEEYIKVVKDNPDAYYGLGASYDESSRGAEALGAYKKYVEVEKRESEKKWVDKARERITALEKEKPAEAPRVEVKLKPEEKPAEPAPKVEAKAEPAAVPSGDPKALEADADKMFSAKDYAGAARTYRGAARGAAKRWEVRYKLGVALALSGDVGGAIRAWEETLELKPDLKAAKVNIKRANAKLTAASDEEVDDARLVGSVEERVALASEYVGAGRPAMALRAADAALREAPEEVTARRQRGLALMQLARYDEAARDLEIAVGKDPGDADTLGALGRCYLQTGDAARATWFLRRYLQQVDPAGSNEAYQELRKLVERLDAQAANP